MQNPQQMAQQIAAMSVANGGPVDGTPIMGNMPQPPRKPDPREQLNTYIYDYFLRNSHHRLARAMIDNDMTMSIGPPQKTSPKNRVNGIDPMDDGFDDLPTPNLPAGQLADNSFLLDWWVQFWDIYQATKARGSIPNKGAQYIQHTRSLAQMQNDQRNQRLMMNNPMNAQYQSMMRNGMPNGVAPNDLKRAAAMNNRPNGNPMAATSQMKNPAMMGAQMQRDGSNMDMNGPRPQSPGANENAPSPNKRPRMEGGMNAGVPGGQFGEFAGPGQNPQQKNIEVYAQTMARQHSAALNNTASPQGMNPGIQGSPMAPTGLDGQQDMFAGNNPRTTGMPGNGPAGAPPQGNHALQDYQMQLMLLEQQNKKRLLMARQEQDSMGSGPQHQGGQGFPAAMSPQGNRPGPSPNPADQMKRGTPKIGPGMPGSPLPESAMQQQRGSPVPNMNFDPNLVPPGLPPQYYPQQMPQQSPMMRPPSSHPGAGFNGQAMNPQQQMEAMRSGQMQPNGAWRGPGQPGMMPGQQPMGGPMGGNMQQRQMGPPPAPASEQPRPEPSPSQSNQAPPTPSQGSKPNPKKKATKDNAKKPANKKGANAGATPAASNGEEPPTPTAASTPVAPITPHSKQSFNPQNGQPQPVQPQQAQQQAMESQPFGNIGTDDNGFGDLGLNFEEGALDNFDFDSFLQQPGDDSGFGIGGEFDFEHVQGVGGEI